MNNTTTREHKHRTKQKPKTNEQAKTQNEPTHRTKQKQQHTKTHT